MQSRKDYNINTFLVKYIILLINFKVFFSFLYWLSKNRSEFIGRWFMIDLGKHNKAIKLMVHLGL